MNEIIETILHASKTLFNILIEIWKYWLVIYLVVFLIVKINRPPYEEIVWQFFAIGLLLWTTRQTIKIFKLWIETIPKEYIDSIKEDFLQIYKDLKSS